MKNIAAVYLRELKSYFVSPIFYIISAVFLVVVGNNFKDNLNNFAALSMQQLRQALNYGTGVSIMNVNQIAGNMFAFMNFIFLLIVPLLTMRLYAEEKKTGTMELLMTSPITSTQVLFGKFLSCLTIYFSMAIMTVLFMVIMDFQSDGAVDFRQVLSGYTGALLYGMAIISIGMFFSSLTENQIVAAAVTLTLLIALWLLIFSARFLAPPFSDFMRYLSLSEHLESFAVGYVGIHHAFYFLSMTVFWLFMTWVTVESARWRQ